MLYLVPTPIGNLEDITLRSLRVLKKVDCIFAEDTRHTLGLLNHFDIHVPLQSCHQHNERECAQKITDLLEQGKEIALVSDAGMPGISDPGHIIVQRVIEAGLSFTVLPGASAATTALVLSGLPCDQFVFVGFLPRGKKQRKATILALQNETRTMILYESPYRLHATLMELSESLQNRNAAVCRELTKMHEECRRGTLSALADHYQETVKGECVLLIHGVDPASLSPEENEESRLQIMEEWVAQGHKAKDAAKRAATVSVSANQLYQLYLKKKR